MATENPLWLNNRIQFARLLCELVAENETLNLEQVAASMDLNLREVYELFNRANAVWEDSKARVMEGERTAEHDARRLGWQEAHDVETGALVVFHETLGIHYTGADAWKLAAADSVDRQPKPLVEYTYAHLEAAACMWEHVLTALRRHREGRNPWDEYREAYGMCALRERVILHAPTLEVAYQAAVANGYDKAFDWEYVPKYMEDHVTRILT